MIDIGYRPREWQKRVRRLFKRFNVLVVHRRAGKALDVATPIPMADGSLKPIGEIVSGDWVLDDRGRPARVDTAHFVMHDRPCVEVTFSDGAKIVCDEDHLWVTQTKLDRAYREGRVRDKDGRMSSGARVGRQGSAKTAKEIAGTLRYSGEANHSVALCGPAEYAGEVPPMDPYILGLWLGDGTSRAPHVTTMDDEIACALRAYAGSHGGECAPTAHQNAGAATTLKVTGKKRGSGWSMQAELSALGVLGNKHIPESYLGAPLEARKELLAGLMDSDGSVRRGRSCEISTKSWELSEGYMRLMWSLGLRPSRTAKHIGDRVYWRVSFRPLFNPFRLKRKSDAVSGSAASSHARNRYIVSVKPVASRPVRCLTVDSPSQQYLCGREHIPTHNTVLAVITLLDAALRTKKRLARYAYIAPLRTQAKAVAWDMLKDFATKVPDVSISEAELHVTLPNGAQIRLWGADDPDAFRGLYFDGVVIDEVADMKPQAWGEVIRPALADRQGWALFIGTPKGENLLSIIFNKAMRATDWFAEVLTIHDTDHGMSDEELEATKESLTPSQWRQEFLCDFSASSDDQLILIEDVIKAQRRVIRPGNYEWYPKLMGVDVARYGDDKSVIAKRQGPMLHKLIVRDNISNMDLAGLVATEWNTWKPSHVFVDAGRGEGVIDALIKYGFQPIPVDFGSQSPKPGYGRMRDYVWHTMAKWVKEEASLPDDPELRQALVSPRYSYGNVRHVMEVESKDSMRKRGLPSPDPGDAVAATFAREIAFVPDPRTREFNRDLGDATQCVFDDHGWKPGISVPTFR